MSCFQENKNCGKIMKILLFLTGLSLIAVGLLRLIFIWQVNITYKFLYGALSFYIM
jgi:hypothetical protein